MVKRTFEIWQDDRPIMRIGTDNEKAEIEFRRYGSWDGHELLTRETILEIRDAMDAILESWLCADKPKTLCPICEREYGGIVPIVFDPADVGRLDMGEVLAGRETGQAMQGGVDTTHEDPDIALYGQSTEDDIEREGRTA